MSSILVGLHLQVLRAPNFLALPTLLRAIAGLFRDARYHLVNRQGPLLGLAVARPP